VITILKYISVFFASGLKFFFGPILGHTYGFHPLIYTLLSVFGMMSTVLLFSFFSQPIKNICARFRNPKIIVKRFTSRNRRFVRIWNQFGIKGVALLTPVFFTPIVGSILVNVVGSKKIEIFKWMLISALFWSGVAILLLKYATWLLIKVS